MKLLLGHRSHNEVSSTSNVDDEIEDVEYILMVMISLLLYTDCELLEIRRNYG